MIHRLKFFHTNSIKLIALILIFIVAGFQSNLNAQNITNNIDYTSWEKLLQNHVSEKGLVDYKGFVKDKKQLCKFTEYLSKNTPNDNWTENQKKAFLINFYNASTIQIIVENYPLNSIKDITGDFSVFQKKYINFNSKKVSLDNIEKDMLVKMGDPRVHFAVNCASISCPKLDNKVYNAENLDKHLDQVTKEFINSDLNKISKDYAKLSKVFKWYKSDFESENQTLIDFINKYSDTKINANAKISYLEYNWNLNSK